MLIKAIDIAPAGEAQAAGGQKGQMAQLLRAGDVGRPFCPPCHQMPFRQPHPRPFP